MSGASAQVLADQLRFRQDLCNPQTLSDSQVSAVVNRRAKTLSASVCRQKVAVRFLQQRGLRQRLARQLRNHLVVGVRVVL